MLDNQVAALLVANVISMVHMTPLTSSYRGTGPQPKILVPKNKINRCIHYAAVILAQNLGWAISFRTRSEKLSPT